MQKNKPLFVIHKMTRPPNFEYGSYSGPTWDTAKIRSQYKAFYSNEDEAQQIANTLSQFNGVGFEVTQVTEDCAECDVGEATLMLVDYPALKRDDGELKVETLAFVCEDCKKMYMHSSSESKIDKAIEDHNKVYAD